MPVNNSKVKVILLCGGKGERLHPLTYEIPKPLIKINNKQIISYIIEHLSKYKFDELIIATGYKSEYFVSYINEYYPHSKYILSGDNQGPFGSSIYTEQNPLPFHYQSRRKTIRKKKLYRTKKLECIC